MKRSEPKKFQVNEKKKRKGRTGFGGMQPSSTNRSRPFGDVFRFIRHFGAGVRKLYVASKFMTHRATAGILGRSGIPWFKLGLAALALFILFKDDIGFSVNMNTVGWEGANSNEQMGVAQSVAFKSPAPPKKVRQKSAAVAGLDDLSEDVVKSYVRRFAKVAEAEMEKFGIPASVKLAQALVESYGGQNPAARDNNNHFGTPLDNKDYETAWLNCRAHSLLLQESYPQLFESGNSYKAWARGLKKAGYSNDRSYDKKIIQVIEAFELHYLDRI